MRNLDRLRRLRRLRRLTWLERRLAVEAALGLVSAYLQVRLVPFGRLVEWHKWQSGDLGDPLPDEQLVVALAAGRMVRAVGRRTPWTSTCLMQSLTVATVLRRRRIASVTHLGMAPTPEGYDAHSWTIAGGRILTGGPGHRRFAVVASYRTVVS